MKLQPEWTVVGNYANNFMLLNDFPLFLDCLSLVYRTGSEQMLRPAAEGTRFIIFCSVNVIGVMIGSSTSAGFVAAASLSFFLSFPWIERLLLGGAKRLNLPHFVLSFIAASLFQSPRCPFFKFRHKEWRFTYFLNRTAIVLHVTYKH